MRVLSLQGPWAAGKSTLMRHICTRHPHINIEETGCEERRRRNEMNLDLGKKKDFLINQELFFSAGTKRYARYCNVDGGILVLDRGPEDVACFSKIHPRAICASWNADAEIADLERRYPQLSSEKIVFLYASNDVLAGRRRADKTKCRSGFNEYMSRYYGLEYEYYSVMHRCTMLDTSGMNVDEVYEKCVHVFNL